jgi:hypothetical protein
MCLFIHTFSPSSTHTLKTHTHSTHPHSNPFNRNTQHNPPTHYSKYNTNYHKNTHFYKTKNSKRERNRKKEKERCTPSTILRTNNHYLPLSTIKPSQTTLKRKSEPKQKGKKKRDFICKCFFVS